MMKTPFIALLLLVAVPAAFAADSNCPRFLHSASQDEQKKLSSRGMDTFQNYGWEFCDSLPKYITEPNYYKASSTALCSNDDTSTAVFNWKFSPKTPCNCTKPYCTQGTDGSCTCNTPPDYSVSSQALVYYNPQKDDCVQYGDVTEWIDVKYNLGDDKVPVFTCPTGFKRATTADRGLVVGVLEQATKTYIWPKIKGTTDGDQYYCDAGIRTMGYPLNIRTTSCVKKPGYVATINGKKYKGSDKIAIVRGTVTYSCYDGARQKSISVDSATVKYKNACFPKIFPADN